MTVPPSAARPPRRPPVPVPRVSGGDLMQWQADVGPVPQHIGVLLHLAGRVDAATMAQQLAHRLASVPTLHRRPASTPFGAGPPVWLAAPPAPVTVRAVDGPSAGYETDDASSDVLLDRATAMMLERLPAGTAPWRCRVLSRDGAGVGVVLVLHHGLADGATGMQILAALADHTMRPDGGPAPGSDVAALAPWPPALPRYRVLVADAWRTRFRHLAAAPRAWRSVRPALAELGTGASPAAPRTPMNRPTGPRRRHAVTTVPEAPLRAAARACGGSLNDAVLVAAADVLAGHAETRGPRPDPVVVSVPVAIRTTSSPTARSTTNGAGNTVGIRPTPVPTTGPLADRITAVARWRHDRSSTGTPGASLPIVIATFRVVHALGLVRWFSDHQRLATTFVTSIPGPARPITIATAEVTGITPLATNQGNQTVAFATSSYAGTLSVSVVADPDAGIDAGAVATAVRARLEALAPAEPDRDGGALGTRGQV